MQQTAARKQQPDQPDGFSKRVGFTTYRVNVHFSGTSKETVNDKIIRLIRSETEKAVNLWK